MPTLDRFDELLDAEIARVKDDSATKPPEEKNPLSLDEYKEIAMDQMVQPNEDQLKRFSEDFGDDFPEIIRFAKPGFKVVPLLMPHDHGYSSFRKERLEKYGHLYYYLMDKNNLTLRARDVAYMDAVLPPEIIENGVVLEEDFAKPEKLAELQQQFKKSVQHMLEMVK